LAACSVYDEALVEQQHGAVRIATPDSGAGSTLLEAGPVVDGGSNEFGPDQNPNARDSGTGNLRCGDGLVSSVEKCDVAIAPGSPGACPTDCPMLDTCVPRVLNGSQCQAECVLRPLTCKSGDGCCPPGCSPETDLDCSPSCGDGIVQQSRGETCESGTDTPCMTLADCDDKDPCTTDGLSGNEMNCNTKCTHTTVTSPKAGDACCPTGANANTDADCKPHCGNGVKETGEDCDGTNGCSATCKLTLGPDQLACLQNAADECEKCACMNCTAKETACRLGTDKAANDLCNGVLVCARKNNCAGQPCYCGTAFGCIGANGPCLKEIEAAAGSTDPLTINSRYMDTTMPLGRSWFADACRVMQCQSVCR
jgi:hypothetical protein